MSSPRILSALPALLLGAALACSASLCGCETETATTTVVDNRFSGAFVYRAWWVATYFPEPVASGASSTEYRGVPATGSGK